MIRAAFPAAGLIQPDPSLTVTINKLPSWKRNTPAPATTAKLGPEQPLGGWGAGPSACSSRNVNDPNVPFPAECCSSVTVLGCRLIIVATFVPENVIFTGRSCA